MGLAPPLVENFLNLDSMTDLATVVQKAYDWNLWILPKVEKFPRSYRFSIGDHLVASSLDLLMNLVDASYQSRNTSAAGRGRSPCEPRALPGASVEIATRLALVICEDLRLINLPAYQFASEGLDEIGRMTGGWWKSERKKVED
jgi:hypothetical protein